MSELPYFRCHDIGDLMTKSVDTASFKDCCARAYLRGKGYEASVESDAIQKGLLVEADAIKEVAKREGRELEKNAITFQHPALWLRGTPDVVDWGSDTVHDTKCPETAQSMLGHVMKENSDHFWQGMAYLLLTGCKNFTVHYVLLDTPATVVEDKIRRAAWKMGAIDEQTPEFEDVAAKIRAQHDFSRLPQNFRYFKRNFKRDQETLDKLVERIEIGQRHIDEIDKYFTR